MSWRSVSLLKTAALAAAALALSVGPAFAHGGGHGGGGHGGGMHGGGMHAGGFHHGGVGGFHHAGLGGFGGFNRGFGGGGFGRGFGFFPFGLGYGLGYGLGGYGGYGRYGLGYGGLGYGGYGRYGLGYGGLGYGGLGYGGYGLGYGGYYPGYVSSYYSPNTYASYMPYSTFAPQTFGYGGGYTPLPANGGAMANVAPTPTDNTARVEVRVPANAEIWFDGDKTSQTGALRQYVTPQLSPGKTYSYEVRARWTANGKPVEEKRTIHVQANRVTPLDFTQPAPTK